MNTFYKIALAFIFIVFSNTTIAQFHIATGELIYAKGSDIIYTNEDITIDSGGIISMESDTNIEATVALTGILEVAANYSNSGTVSLPAANYTINGVPTIIGSTLKLSGNNSQNLRFGAQDEVYRLELAKPSGTATAVAGVLTVTHRFKSSSGTLDGSEKIILKSNSELNLPTALNLSTAIVEESTAGNVNNLIVQRFIPAGDDNRRAYRLLSSPTSGGSIKYNWQENQNNSTFSEPWNSTGTTGPNQNTNSGFGTHISGSITGLNGFDATASGNASLFTFNNSDSTWITPDNTDATILNAGTPYRVMVRGDRSINLTSNTSTPSNTILQTKGSLSIGSKNQSFTVPAIGSPVFVGNPYQATISASALKAASTNMSDFIYIWDVKLNTRGGYVTRTISTETNSVASNVNNYIQPGQAFFVSTTDITGSINFAENQKVTEDLNLSKTYKIRNQNSKIGLTLFTQAAYTVNATPADGLQLLFSSNENNAIDFNDAKKLENQDEDFASVNESSHFAIQNRAIPQHSETIPLYMSKYRTTNYVIQANIEEMNDINTYLHDYYTNTTTILPNGKQSQYSFIVDPANTSSNAENRFEIRFASKTLNVNNTVFDNAFTIYPNPVREGKFYVNTNGIVGELTSISIYNGLGQLIHSYKQTVPSNGQLLVNIPSLTTGIFTVQLTTVTGKQFTSKLINK
jgi:hypothetical protein